LPVAEPSFRLVNLSSGVTFLVIANENPLRLSAVPMKITIAIAVLAIVVLAIALALRRSGRPRARDEAYAQLKALPAVAKDFTTPEGPILCLEDAYRRRDIEAAIAAKDFKTEARLMLEKTGFKDHVDDEMIAKTAEALVEGLDSFFTKREPHADKVVLVTEMCRFPDGGFSQQQILVAETPQGWRVLNPISK
jgi:hypothetical protein